MKKSVIVILLCVCACFAAVHTVDSPLARPVDIQVIRASRSAIYSSIDCVGRIEEERRDTIYASRNIVIEEKMVEIGDYVDKGTLLALARSVKPPEQYAADNASTHSAASDLQSGYPDINAVSDSIYGQILQNRIDTGVLGESLSAMLGLPEWTTSSASIPVFGSLKPSDTDDAVNKDNDDADEIIKIISEHAGVVTYSGVQQGDYAAQNMPLYTISDTSKYQVRVNIKETLSQHVRKGQSVQISGDAFEGRLLTGVVLWVHPSARQIVSGTQLETVVEALVSLDGDTSGIRPGNSAIVKIITDVKPNTFTLPYEAVLQDEQGREYVFVASTANGASEDDISPVGVAHKRFIRTGLELDTTVEVLSGIREDELIILNPPENMSSIQRVNIVRESR